MINGKGADSNVKTHLWGKARKAYKSIINKRQALNSSDKGERAGEGYDTSARGMNEITGYTYCKQENQ